MGQRKNYSCFSLHEFLYSLQVAETPTKTSRRGQNSPKTNTQSQQKSIKEDVEKEVEADEVGDVNYDSMSKKDLLKEAANMAIEVDAKATKAVIIASLKANIKSANSEEQVVDKPVSEVKKPAANSRRGRADILKESELEKVASPAKKDKGKSQKAQIVEKVENDKDEPATDKPKRGRAKKVCVIIFIITA